MPRTIRNKRQRLPGARTPKGTIVPLLLDPMLVNMLVAYEKIRSWPIEAISQAEEKISRRLFALWQAQYPRKFYILPAIRPKSDFE